MISLSVSTFLSANAKEIVVTNNQNSGSGSLREVVSSASDGDKITFSSDFTIHLETAIELGDKTLTIDGLAGGNKVILDGNYLDADNDTIDDDGLYTRIFTVIGQTEKKVNLSNLIIQHGSTRREENSPESWPLYKGGGMYIDMTAGGTLTVTDCLIQNNILARRKDGYDGFNQVHLYGAGIYSEYGGDFVNCTIKNNTIIAKNSFQCNYFGGGAYVQKFGSFSNCLIAGNRFLFEPVNNENFFNAGGAGLCLSGRSLVQNCVIIGNIIKNISDELQGYFSDATGAGIVSVSGYVFSSSIICNGIYNVDLGQGRDNKNNLSVACGGALLTVHEDDEEGNYQNNIIYGNYCSSGEFHDGISASGYTKYTAFSDASDFETSKLDETSMVIEKSPFVDLPVAGEDGEWGTDDDFYGDLRLKENAACIDAGNPDESQFSHLNLDFYGRGRINNNRIDIGALEFYASDVVYSLSGKVHAGNSPLANGKVQAIDAANTNKIIASVITGEDGSFEFPSLIPDEYLFFAVPDDASKYYPTYYGDETELDNAISINVNDIIYDVDIHLVSKTSTGINDEETMGIKVYPNPASEFVTISGANNLKGIIIYDSYRSEIKRFDGRHKQISVSNLKPGLYIISIVMDEATVNRQLIIKQ
jgi:hypothetical protein